MELIARVHRNKLKRVSSWVIAALLTFQIGAFLEPAAASAAELEEVKASGVLRVAGFPDPLNEFFRPSEGGYDGLDIQLLDAFARSIGVQLEVVPIERFEDAISDFLNGTGDILAGSITITEERQELVDFSDSYFPVLVSVVVKAGNSVSTVDGLKGLAASGSPGTSHDQILQGLGNSRIDYFATTEEMYAAVAEGRVDFTIDDATTALNVLQQYPNLRIAFELPEVSHFGFAVPPGSDLKPALDDFLATAMQGESYYRLVLRHLGSSGVEALRMVRDL